MDYQSKLMEIQDQINLAQQELANHNSVKAGLNREKQSIITACKELGIDPNRNAVEQEIVSIEEKLEGLLSEADKILRRDIKRN
jgi:chromosome segregation ATPase